MPNGIYLRDEHTETWKMQHIGATNTQKHEYEAVLTR